MKASISFPDKGALATLYRLSQDQGTEWAFSQKVAHIVTTYSHLIRRSVPKLTKKEWHALFAAHWSHLFTAVDYQSNMLALNVEDSDLNELSPDEPMMTEDERTALVKKLNALTLTELVATVEWLQVARDEINGWNVAKFIKKFAVSETA